MPWDDMWNYGAEDDPEYRRKVLQNKLLDPLGISLTTKTKIGETPESPAEFERKRQKAAADLAKHDALFGVYPGCTIPAIYKTTPPPAKLPEEAFGIGDMDAQIDGGD